MQMQVGVFVMPEDELAEPAGLAQLGVRLDELGCAALWMGEHVVWFDEYTSPWPYRADGSFKSDPLREHLEIFEALTFLAAVTTHMRLGTGITLVPQRNPVYLAKSVMSLDVLSAGRFDFGVGVGWNKAEFDATMTPWARRGARTDEYLAVMTSLWTEDPSAFSGEFYTLAPCHLHPKPVQQPHPPIHVAGHSQGALQRAVTRGQGWYGWISDPQQSGEIVVELTGLLEQRGRSIDDFQITVTPPVALELDRPTLEAYQNAGVNLLLPYYGGEREAGIEHALDPIKRALDMVHNT